MLGINSYNRSYYNMMLNSVNPDYSKVFMTSQESSTITNYQNFDSMYQQMKNINSIYKDAATVSSVKNSAKDLYSAASNLTSYSKGTFANREVVSDDSTKVTATAKDGTFKKDYTVSVQQVAKSQINTGVSLSKDVQSNVNTGTNKFRLQNGTNTKDISFDVNSGDTNQKVLDNMAKAINDSKFGVSASVIKDDKTSTISLKLTSQTGEKNNFTISDLQGDSVSKLGANSKTQNAQDSAYKINNVSFTSSKNEATTDNGNVTITLKDITSKDIKLSVKEDSKTVESDVRKFIDSYNNLVNTASSTGTDNKNINAIISDVKNNSYNLSQIGITYNKEDDTLKLNSNKLKTALTENSSTVKDVIGDYDSVASKTKYQAKLIENNPLGFLGLKNYNFYQNNMSILNSYQNQGNFFDGLF